MRKMRSKIIVAGILLIAGMIYTPVIMAQSTDTEETEKVRKNWDELMHYAVIGRLDLAKEFGQALLESEPDPVFLLRLAESDRYTNSYRNLNIMQGDPDLQEIATTILKLLVI